MQKKLHILGYMAACLLCLYQLMGMGTQVMGCCSDILTQVTEELTLHEPDVISQHDGKVRTDAHTDRDNSHLLPPQSFAHIPIYSVRIANPVKTLRCGINTYFFKSKEAHLARVAKHIETTDRLQVSKTPSGATSYVFVLRRILI